MLRRNRNQPSAAEGRDGRALVGVIAAGLLLGGVATVVLRSAGEWINPPVADAGNTATRAVAGAKSIARPAGATAPAPAASGSAPSATPPAPAKPAAGNTPAKAAPKGTGTVVQ